MIKILYLHFVEVLSPPKIGFANRKATNRKSANRKLPHFQKVFKSKKIFADFRFAEPICGPPAFVIKWLYVEGEGGLWHQLHGPAGQNSALHRHHQREPRQDCCLSPLQYHSWARIFKRVWGPGIDSKEWIPPAYVAWRAGTITLFLLGSKPP